MNNSHGSIKRSANSMRSIAPLLYYYWMDSATRKWPASWASPYPISVSRSTASKNILLLHRKNQRTMEFEEMQKIWSMQNNEALYVINEKALHNRILSKKKSASHIVN